MKNNISTICENSLCTGCGACGGVCPAKCILLKRNTAGFLRAYIDKKQCLECGRCVKVCPQIRMMDIDKSRREVKGFIAYAKNLQVRKRGQSGGVVTALLSFLLKKGEIDGAVINKFNRDRHINEAVYVDDNEMLLEGAGSYYSQSDVCKTIYENKSRKVAAVLLGCQSRSVKMAENAGELKNVKYKIGLICAGQYSSLMMKDIVKKSKVTLPEVIKFRWRDKQISGWPGDVSIETSSGNYTLPSKERMKLKQIYKNLACSICQDKMNQNADIVCGDPWGLHIDEIEQGYSCVLARTKKGYDLLVKAQEEGYIYLEPCDADDITRGQNVTDEYFIEKEKIRRFFQANNWIYPYIFSSKCTNVDNETLKRFEIKQLEYEKKLYDCDDMKKIARLIRIKKVIYQIEIVKILYKVIKSKLVNRIKLEKKAYKH